MSSKAQLAKKKVLFVSPCTPNPRGVGREQRTYSVLSAYSKFADVNLWYIPTATNPALDRIMDAFELCESVVPFFGRQFRNHQRTQIIWNSYSSNADLVHVCDCRDLMPKINHRNLIWDLDGNLSDPLNKGSLDGRVAQTQSEYDEFIRSISASVSKCKTVFVSSEIGIDLLDCPATLLRNSIAEPRVVGRDTSTVGKSLLFIGGLNYPPNIQALTHFSSEIYPILNRNHPGVEIHIVGISPKIRLGIECVSLLEKNPSFAFHFDVPDCTPFLNKCSVSIAPILSGDGTRIKIIEAFANNSPVVSTSKGCEGLGVTDGQELLIADDPKAFADACSRLLNDQSLAQRLTQNGYSFYRKYHSQDAMDQTLKNEISPLLYSAL